MKLRTKTVLIAALTLVPAFALAWTGPTQSPPNGNVAAPINTGSSAQAKSGDFAITGNFGAGTVSPQSVLHAFGSGAVPLILERSSASNVGIEFRDANSSWFAGQGSGGNFNIDDDADIGSGPLFTLTTSGSGTFGGSLTATQLCMGASCRSSWPSTTFGGTYAYGAAVCPGVAAGTWEQVQCSWVGEGGTICSTIILGMYCRDVYIN